MHVSSMWNSQRRKNYPVGACRYTPRQKLVCVELQCTKTAFRRR